MHPLTLSKLSQFPAETQMMFAEYADSEARSVHVLTPMGPHSPRHDHETVTPALPYHSGGGGTEHM